MKTPLRIAAVMVAALLLGSCSSTNDPTKPEPNSTSDSAASAAPIEPLLFNSSALLAGTAQPTFADGDPGQVSVVQVGPLQKPSLGASLLFAFRNNTTAGISHVDWTATARSAGAIVATGSSQGTIPAQVAPGEVGLAYIYFENGEVIPDGTEYEFTVDTSTVDTESYNTAPLKVTEASIAGDAIVGSATNESGAETTGPFSVSVYCFDGDNISSQFGSFAEQDGPIQDGGTVTFSAGLYGGTCSSFAVGVGGYFS